MTPDTEMPLSRVVAQKVLGIRPRESPAVAEAFETVGDLVEFYRSGKDLTNITGIGSKTASNLSEWVQETFPAAHRARYGDDPTVCIQFTSEHGVDPEKQAPDAYYFAFICPRCDARNSLQDDPALFKDRRYRCPRCNWTVLLDATALETFRAHNYPPAEETEQSPHRRLWEPP